MRSAHELVMSYADACKRAREPMRDCERDTAWCEEHEVANCYYEWKANRLASDSSELRRATPEEIAEWCPACQFNEAVAQRRASAARERGALLRSMQRYAARLPEPPEVPCDS